jgi:tripartite-type tricarboxylate transporter receptor subunit TctC
MIKTLNKCSTLIFLFASFSFSATAADYPDHRLLAIVPFVAGSSNDIMARRITPPLSKMLGQSIIIDNKPGADGRIGVEAAAKSPRDAYTLLFSGGAVALIPAVRKNVNWDPDRDIQPIAELGESPYVIVVNPRVPANNVLDLIKLAKKYPGKLNGGAGGNSTEMAITLFRIMNNINVETIPYKGTGLAANAVAGGDCDFAIMDGSAWTALVPTGRVRALAVAGEKRLPILPNVPTTKEAGLPDYVNGTMFGVYTTGGSPINAVRRLNAEINRIIATQEIEASMSQVGLYTIPRTVEGFTQMYVRDLARWKDVVKRGNIPMTD